jgi:hypothetical protein
MSRAAVETAQRYYVDAYARKHIEIFEAALAAAPSAARTIDPSFE